MAVTTTVRFGLKLATDGTDPWPGRAGWMQMLQSLENKSAQFVQGTLAARPTPTVQGRFYVVTGGAEAGSVWYDTGTAWVSVGATLRTVLAATASASVVPAIARGAAGQTADLQQWQNSAGTALARVLPTGQMVVAAGSAATHTITKAQLDAVAGSIPQSLSAMAAPPNAPVLMGGQRLTSLGAGSAASDAVTKAQLDAVAGSIPARLNQLTANGNVAMSGYRFTGLGAGAAAGDSVNKSQLDAVAASVPTRLNQLTPNAHVGMAGFRLTNLGDGTVATDAVTKGQLDAQVGSLTTQIGWVAAAFQATSVAAVTLRTTAGTTIGSLDPATGVHKVRRAAAGALGSTTGWFALNTAQVSAWNAAGGSAHLAATFDIPAESIAVASAAYFDRSTGDWFFGYALVVGPNANAVQTAAGYQGVTMVSALWVHTAAGSKPSGVTPSVPFTWQAGDVIVLGAFNTLS